MTRRVRARGVGVHPTCLLTTAGVLLTSLALGACHQDTPPLAMAETNTIGTESVLPEDDEAEEADEESRIKDGRELYFAHELGREAILARERRDHARAIELLEELLEDEQLPDRTRAGAELLRGLEALRQDQHGEAAEHLARARTSETLASIEPALRLIEAQARLDAQDSKAALALVEDLDPNLEAGVSAQVLMIRADAQARTNHRDQARASYKAFLAQAEGRERHEARRKLAVLLLEGEADSQLEAAKLFEQLVAEVPLSEYGQEAERELVKLEKAKRITRSKADKRVLERNKALAEVERELDRRDYGDAIKAADAVMKRAKQLGLDAGHRCQLLYLKGSAIFKMRKRPAAQPVFDEASKQCKKAGERTLEVKTRYQAARGVYSAGKHEQAAARFESIAATFADHSYADDAWVKAGEAWESAGEAGKARAAYESSLSKHPDGDMADEALRRLLVQAFSEKRIPDALDLIDRSIASAKVHGDTLAKLHYFRGKALDHLGRDDEAEAAWLETITTRPLSYPALQACSRLRERGEDALARALALIEAASATELPTLELPDSPTARRVEIWASLGLGEQAHDELTRAGIKGWPAVAVLDQAGLYSEAQRLLANLGGGWRDRGPSGSWRALWELAHPAPFRALVASGEQAHGVPTWLTYAIMQSESRFNPGATSWAGARGLIQLMPATAENVAQRAGLKIKPSELYDPATNLDIGQRYLAGLTARWGNVDGAPALAVPSYNAGPGRTDDWISARGNWDLDLFVEAIPFDETRRYTQSVLGRWAVYRWLYADGDASARMPYIPLKIPGRAD